MTNEAQRFRVSVQTKVNIFRTELIEHARRILEADMKRRQREKRANSRPATRAESHDHKSRNPFGSNLDTPGNL